MFYEEAASLRELVTPSTRRLSVFVGPEGGFDPEEIDAIRRQGGGVATLPPDHCGETASGGPDPSDASEAAIWNKPFLRKDDWTMTTAYLVVPCYNEEAVLPKR